jgi:DNA helicase HerA-like ATPase
VTVRIPPGCPAYRISELPRPENRAPDGAGRITEGGDGRRQRAAALAAAFHAGLASPAGGTVAFGWVRTATGGPVSVIVAGQALAGGARPAGLAPAGDASPAAEEVLLALPAGARGRMLPPGGLDALLGQLGCWREIGGISDGLLAPAGDGAPGVPAGRPAGLSLDQGLLASWTGPFGWLVVADPVSPDGLRSLAEEAGRRQRLAEASADRFPERAAAARRLRERQAELQRGASTGFWRMTLWAGGPDAAAAARIAGLLCAAADLDGLPYALSPAPLNRAPLSPASRGPVAGEPVPAAPRDAARPDNGGPGADGPSADGPDNGRPSACGPGAGGPSSAWPDNGGPDAGGFGAPGAGVPGVDGPDNDGPASPFLGTTGLLAALARPPEAEIPGVRLALAPDFDVNPEAHPGPGVRLGDILDRNLMPAGPLTVPRDSLNRHVLVCGATGSGKSQTVRALLEAATGAGLPWLVVEPAKAEYRLMAARLPGAEVIRIAPGEPDAIAAGLNPLEPAADQAGQRFPLQTHADLVRALFIASFRSEEPFPQVMSAALGRVYEDAGWDLALGERRQGDGTGLEAAYPGLTALRRAAEQVVTEIGYSQRVTDDVLGFIRVRLASLSRGTTGLFLEGGHPIDFGALLRKNVVLEIEDVGDDADKAFLMGVVLIRLVEHLRLTHRTARGGASAGLRHLTVIEEAHRLLRRPGAGDAPDGGGAAGHAVEMFCGLLAEIRAYGEGLIIAEQIPALLAPDALKNTAVKIVHRLPAADDREIVGATMNATSAQSRYLVTLTPGRAAFFCDGMDLPVLAAITDGTEREGLAPGRTADAGTLVRPRSATCGRECGTRPCTLREMRAASWALDDLPWAGVWAELAVLAHLTGWPAPVPRPARLAELTARPARVRQCALAHAVDAAVAARPGIARPVALAVHVSAAIAAWIDRREWFCPPDEPHWLAAGPVTETLAFGLAQPSVIEAAGPVPELLAAFIECDWPLAYLRRRPQ